MNIDDTVREDAESAGCDELIEAARILDEVEAGIPRGCRARSAFIMDKAQELKETFINGNKSDVLKALESMPKTVAFAVLATIMDLSDGKDWKNPAIGNYFREVA